MTGGNLSANSVWRICLEAGGRLNREEAQPLHSARKAQVAANAAFWAGEASKTEPEAAPSHPMRAELKEGSALHVRREGWKEVKVSLAAGVQTKTVRVPTGESVDKVGTPQPSYRAGLWNAEELGLQAWSEGRRRGLDQAQTLWELGDGAVWRGNLNAQYHPKAVEIVDWYPASEHIWEVAGAIFGAAETPKQAWGQSPEASLWEGEAEAVLRALEKLTPKTEAAKTCVRQNLGYFETNKERMRYGRFRENGYLIGSGSIEGGGCQNLVGARMKLAGRRWSREGADAMLCLRSKLFSDRWEEVGNPPDGRLAKAA